MRADHERAREYDALSEGQGAFSDSSGIIQRMKALESGRVLLSDRERRRYVDAAVYLEHRCGTTIDTESPVTAEELLFLELARGVLAGDLEKVDRLIAEIEAMIALRLRPH